MLDFNKYTGKGGFRRLIQDILLGFIIYILLVISYPCVRKQQLKDRAKRIEAYRKESDGLYQE